MDTGTDENTQATSARRLHKAIAAIPRQLDLASKFLELHSWLLIPALAMLYSMILRRSRSKLLWYDELYTYYIAQAPSLKEMLLWIRTVDLNPPLYYLAVRLTFHVLHPSSLSARLPSMIAYFVGATCLFQFVRFRLGPLYGVLSALILLGSSYAIYSYEARPYAFVLGFLGIAMVGWQGATESSGWMRCLSLLAVLLGGFGMLLSHVLALVPYSALLFAEAIRSLQRRRNDALLWACLSLPLLSCILYVPLIRQHAAGIYPPAFQASVQAVFENYASLWIDVAPFLAATAVLIAIVDGRSAGLRPKFRPTGFTVPEMILFLGLLLVPLAVIVDFMRSHSQFFPRYGMAAVIGVAALVPMFISWWTYNSRRAALVAAVIFAFAILRPSSVARILQDRFQPSTPDSSVQRELPKSVNDIDPGLPFVDADGLTFVAMNYYEPSSFLSRVYYLTDPDAAFRYAHANGFNGMATIKGKFPVRANIESYENFITRHRKFLVFGTYDYPDDWLLSKLLADNATIRFLGQFKSDYKDHELYEVTLDHP